MGNQFLGFPVPRAKIAEMIAGAAPPLAHAAWHRPVGSDPLAAPGDISDGQAVVWDAALAKFKGASAGGISSAYETPGVFISTWFDSKDGWNVYASASASVALSYTELALVVQAVANQQAYITKAPTSLHFAYSWAQALSWTAFVRIVTGASHKGTVYVVSGSYDNYRHVGFKLKDGLLKASVANGSTETLSATLADISSGAQDVHYRLAVEYTATAAKFYIDDVLVATLDAGLPAGTSEASQLFYIENKNDANGVYCRFEISYLKLWKRTA